MPTHKSSDYKLSAVKYYLSHSKNQVQTCKIFGCSERSLMRWVDKYKSSNNTSTIFIEVSKFIVDLCIGLKRSLILYGLV